jgi:hypothetical protein
VFVFLISEESTKQNGFDTGSARVGYVNINEEDQMVRLQFCCDAMSPGAFETYSSAANSLVWSPNLPTSHIL